MLHSLPSLDEAFKSLTDSPFGNPLCEQLVASGACEEDVNLVSQYLGDAQQMNECEDEDEWDDIGAYGPDEYEEMAYELLEQVYQSLPE
jgi:hypothetical protein